MDKLTKQQERIKKVLERTMDLICEYKDFADYFQDAYEDLLDQYHMDDGFGTEGECDPRGDFRDGKWSMKKVQGVK